MSIRKCFGGFCKFFKKDKKTPPDWLLLGSWSYPYILSCVFVCIKHVTYFIDYKQNGYKFNCTIFDHFSKRGSMFNTCISGYYGRTSWRILCRSSPRLLPFQRNVEHICTFVTFMCVWLGINFKKWFDCECRTKKIWKLMLIWRPFRRCCHFHAPLPVNNRPGRHRMNRKTNGLPAMILAIIFNPPRYILINFIWSNVMLTNN